MIISLVPQADQCNIMWVLAEISQMSTQKKNSVIGIQSKHFN